MRRRFVSEEDRDKVIKLRKSGAGWLKIEEMTGIPRRTAKNVYEEWQESQTAEEVVTARRQVAAEAFNLHMRDLIMLAREITTSLTIPALSDRRNGGQVLDNIFEKDIRGSTHEASPFSLIKRDTATTVRQNHILFDSLKQHTRGKVNWGLVDNWSVARDDWYSRRELLEKEVRKLVRDMVDKHNVGAVGSTLRQPGISDRMVKGLIETTYHMLIDNGVQAPEKYIKVRKLKAGSAILFGGDTSNTELIIEDTKIAVIIAKYCKDIAKVFAGKESSLIAEMAVSLAKMREAYNELTDKLEELRLTPVILQTKCDICPA